MRFMIRKTAVVLAAVLITSGVASAASVPDGCQATKNKESGSLLKCLQSAEAKLVVSGDNVGYAEAVTACEAKFSDKWSAAELKATAKGESCQTTGDQATIQAAIAESVDCIAEALSSGDTSCLLCGNGQLDTGEDCDFGEKGAGTCATEAGSANPIGTLNCSPGCRYDSSACFHGAAAGGSQWFLAVVGQSCDQVCASQGAVYDPATGGFAGSGGSNANCATVLFALGYPVPGVQSSNTGGGMGCFLTSGGGFRDTSTTTSWASLPASIGSFSRACACM
jgi:hypothetical protein